MGGLPRPAREPKPPYPVILADPPWPARDRGTRMAPCYSGRQRAAAQYPTMRMHEIIATVREIVTEWAAIDGFMFLWVPNYILDEVFELGLFRAWGYRYKTTITWIKTTLDRSRPRIGGGHYTRSATEHLLVGRRGRARVRTRSEDNVIWAPRTRHSAKPDESYRKIERLHAGPYLELFARRRWGPRWAVWGDEAPT